MNEYSELEVYGRINHHLSKWIQKSEPDDDWVADPLFGRLPDRLNIAKGRATLSRLLFLDADVAMLREAMWMRDISRQFTSGQVRDVALAKWLVDQEEELGADTVHDLGIAYEMFDWVVRNIQSESASESPDGVPCSNRLAWEALLLGRGDQFAKSRVFLLLARQQGIPVVMLGIDRDDGDTDSWLPAAFVNGQLFLFDMLLGVPVPADGDAGIATLGGLIEQPEILGEMTPNYRVKADDLKKVVALIDGTPAYLSQRMKLVEMALTAENKMKLTCRPSLLGKGTAINQGNHQRCALASPLRFNSAAIVHLAGSTEDEATSARFEFLHRAGPHRTRSVTAFPWRLCQHAKSTRRKSVVHE